MNRPDDWQPGDLALCVRENPLGEDNTKPGRVYEVLRVGMTVAMFPHGRVGTGLVLKGVKHLRKYCDASRFRKIRPHTPDAEDAETIALLTGKPAKVTA